MRNLLPVLALLLAASASAETALPAFEFTSLAQLRAQKPAVAAPAAKATDVVDKSSMHVQAGKDSLFGYADTAEQADQAVAYWSGVLRAAGIQPGASTYKDGLFALPYRTADGRVLRDFMAEPRQFPPKDEAGLRANMALALKSLNAAGLTPVSAKVLNLEFLLPTYSILYLAKAEALPERETRLRLLKNGDEVAPDLLKASGVSVVQKPEPWLVVYIGPELGYVGLWAKTPEDLSVKLETRKAFLTAQGKKIVGEKLVPIDDAEYKFGAELLFFQ